MARIFVVEDHPIMREMIREFIQLAVGHTICHEVGTGQEALDEVDEYDPDLVIIDVALPDVSGIEVARVLRERYPDLRLVMLSGHGETSHVDEALKAGANGYILKGDSDEIPSAIRQLLDGEEYLSPRLASVREKGSRT